MAVNRAAQRGRTKEVLDWLKSGGDINASDPYNNTVVHLAAMYGEIHLLRKLLQLPHVHLNQGHENTVNLTKGKTPLCLAIGRGHEECVEALLSSTSMCKASLDGRSVLMKDALRNAINKKWWKIILMLIEAGLVLQMQETMQVLFLAINNHEMGIVKIMIERDFPIDYKTPNLGQVLTSIFDYGMWDYVGADKLFKKGIRVNNYSTLKVLKVVLREGNLILTEKLIKFLLPRVTLNARLSNAITEKELEKVQEIYHSEELTYEDLNGALVIAAVSGTTETITEVLLDGLDHTYPDEVMDYVFIMAALYNHFQFYHILLRKHAFSYPVLVDACRLASQDKVAQDMIEGVLRNTEKNVSFFNHVKLGKVANTHVPDFYK